MLFLRVEMIKFVLKRSYKSQWKKDNDGQFVQWSEPE